MDETAKRRDGETARKRIRHFRDLEVYHNALAPGLRVYELSKTFPPEEKYSLTDQIRRSSRSVCANIAEAWRKRRYKAALVSKLSDSEGEAAETQVHLEFAFHHRSVSDAEFLSIDDTYENLRATCADDRSTREMAYSPTRAQAMTFKAANRSWAKRQAIAISSFRRLPVSPFRCQRSSPHF